MSWSVSRAAKEAGLSKSTISRAIKSGRISAKKQDDGSYLIEAAELFRVYPQTDARVTQPPSGARHDAVRNPPEESHATTSTETEVLRVRLEMTEAMLDHYQETVADLRKRLDTATDQVRALTPPAQPPPEARHDAVHNPAQPPLKRGIWDILRRR